MTRLDQLNPKDLIRLSCAHCERVRDIPSRFMAAICGEHLTLSTIRHRLRCRECGSRGINTVVVLYGQVDPQGDYFIYREPNLMFGN